jgi:hypothetical protein
MSNYTGLARTNHVSVASEGALVAALEGFEIEIRVNAETKKVSLLSRGQVGWGLIRAPRRRSATPEDLDNGYESFSIERHVMPFVQEGEVLVSTEIGNTQLAYLTGVSTAYIRQGKVVKTCELSLNDIYCKAAETFKVKVNVITHAEY